MSKAKAEAVSFVIELLEEAVKVSPQSMAGYYPWRRENRLYLNGKDKGRFTPKELRDINEEVKAIHAKLLDLVKKEGA